jgi:acyl carrier protein
MEDHVRKDHASVLERLRSSPKGARRSLLVEFIERQVLDILHWDESRRPDLIRGFVAIGLDSLMAVELQFRLQKALKFVSPRETDGTELELASAEDLADFLLNKRLNLDVELCETDGPSARGEAGEKGGQVTGGFDRSKAS